jgi:hypothetical protein
MRCGLFLVNGSRLIVDDSFCATPNMIRPQLMQCNAFDFFFLNRVAKPLPLGSRVCVRFMVLDR